MGVLPPSQLVVPKPPAQSRAYTSEYEATNGLAEASAREAGVQSRTAVASVNGNLSLAVVGHFVHDAEATVGWQVRTAGKQGSQTASLPIAEVCVYLHPQIIVRLGLPPACAPRLCLPGMPSKTVPSIRVKDEERLFNGTSAKSIFDFPWLFTSNI
jgi:hypothetical protein